MVDVPSQVQYGKVIGRFVSFVADSNDPGTVPDEVPLTGTVTITPNTPLMRFINTDPPRTAVISILECRVINGDLYAPNSSTPGVWMMASEQPAGQPDHVQFTARFNFNELSGLAQPVPVVFEVPVNGTIDLAMAMGVDPDPGTVVVVSTEGVAEVEQIYQDIKDIIDGGGIIMGDDGREVELRNSGTAIQWRYVDTPELPWVDLILTSELEGPPGADGSIGPKGDKGDAGSPGDKLTMGTITTGDPGTEAVASITGVSPNKVLDLTIPRGNPGVDGADGDTLSIGTVTTGAAGSAAQATITGDSPDKQLNLVIPRGNTGATGPASPKMQTYTGPMTAVSAIGTVAAVMFDANFTNPFPDSKALLKVRASAMLTNSAANASPSLIADLSIGGTEAIRHEHRDNTVSASQLASRLIDAELVIDPGVTVRVRVQAVNRNASGTISGGGGTSDWAIVTLEPVDAYTS